jgi:hypothetical protein
MKTKEKLLQDYSFWKANGDFIRVGKIKAELKSKHGMTDKDFKTMNIFGVDGIDMLAEMFGMKGEK